MTNAIHILNASVLAAVDLMTIVRPVTDVFGHPAELEPASLNVAMAYDNTRRQYNSTALLAQILKRRGTSGGKSITVVDVDLYIPVLTFVFGEAQFSGEAAIVSTHRLRNQFYGMPRNDGLLVGRLSKEIIHELGHTFGLYHCRQFECVMRSSTYVEEIDLKHAVPCPACQDMIRKQNNTQEYLTGKNP